MNMSAEQEAMNRAFAKEDAKRYKTGELTKDEIKKEIQLAFKYKDWPYLEELEDQEIGSIIWKWKNE